MLDTVRNVGETSISESMNEGDTVVVEELSVEVKVTYLCHMCHKEMEAKDISPFMEWHICNKCMEEEDV